MKPAAPFFVFFLLILTGCTSMQPDLDPPKVTVNSFKAVPGNTGGLSFEVGLRIVNPNRQDLELEGVAYTISLEGREVVAGVGKDLPIVKGYDEATLTLTAAVSMLESLRLLGSLMDEPKDSLSYEINTKLDIGAFYKAIRVTDSGQINLQPNGNR